MGAGDKINATQWIAWLAATAAAALTMSSYVFGYFETKQDAIDKRDQFTQRLERIENKVDQLTRLVGRIR